MINLAPIRYRNIHQDFGGPISRLSFREFYNRENILQYEAYAYLKDELRPDWIREGSLYGSADGTGTAKSRSLAVYKAISEALERWAFFQTCRSVNSSKFGFTVEPNTSGMAAFPALTASAARRIAQAEAVERWLICQWWQGRVPVVPLFSSGLETSGAIQLLGPWVGLKTCIVWAQKEHGVSYGFASANSLKVAAAKAEIERFRNERALALHAQSRGDLFSLGSENAHSVESFSEERIRFFASEYGKCLFLDRVKNSTAIRLAPKLPAVIVDSKIAGPWEKFAFVWRVLFKSDALHLSESSSFFFF